MDPNSAILGYSIAKAYPCFQPASNELLAAANFHVTPDPTVKPVYDGASCFQGGGGGKRKSSKPLKTMTKEQLYEVAKRRGIKGRSSMNKQQLLAALSRGR